MHWFSPQDHSAPVIHPEKHAQSKYPGQPLPALPRQAVVFCLGKGLPLLQERFAPSLALDQLPGSSPTPRCTRWKVPPTPASSTGDTARPRPPALWRPSTPWG